ncbi:MAG TPA: HAMP domain-containing sensor histidine kinase, partial [Sphingomicrobium sp.]
KAGSDSIAGQASLADIEVATERLQHLLVQLLALARAESATGSEAAPKKRVDIVELARKVAVDFAPAALRAGVELVFDGPEKRAEVATAPALATELISNLIDNAIRYNRAGGEVLVRFGQSDSEVMVVIEDDGPGIPAGEHEMAFARFKRFAGQQRPGSGLGLAIARALAEAIGASISLRDRPSRAGLTAEVTFPKGRRKKASARA